ncbi:trypsin-like serine peptidase [Enterococcus faecalis]|uniref:trypsin-like serine peptidase n=1 Tax=Enterococcus faecalis TaxID=1351 RepID=UPI002935FAA9|nr:trypsin-like peptidase domain-containing protein [Enterococcus faecalis]MDV2933732.1 trypsin-like peptidase domain-containing protein [Enterococcus faecalis]
MEVNFSMKMNRLLVISMGFVFSVCFLIPVRGYAEVEPLVPSAVDINVSNELSASEISSYDLETNIEVEQPLPISARARMDYETNSFVPEGISKERSDRQIIGADTRTRITNTVSFPNSTIGKMVMTFPNGQTYVGTGWRYGNKVAITAGHCVYSKRDGGWARSVAFYPGKNDSSNPLGVYYATSLFTDTKYIATEDSNYDWGMLRFSSNVGYKTGYLGAEWSTGSQVGTTVTVRGYPGERQNQMWTSSGRITGSGSSKTNYSIDTTGGQSGAPVYRYSSGSYRALAIHTNSYGSYNQGERIDRSLFNIMNSARSW